VQSSTIIDLGRFSLSYGDGKRLDLPVLIGPVELGGQTYLLSPESTQVRLDISRPAHGYAFRMRFPVRLDGPCMRCLEQATVATEVDAREVDQRATDDEELHSPYVNDDNELDLGRWAHDAAVLALPTRILCRPDCAGLCPVCGESLNDNPHEHEAATDPRWSALKDLKLE
jgi:uncharacterized protein